MIILTLFVKIVFVIIALLLILVVLLQAGRGGGLGTALGGGASQSVFGGGGGADFLAKLTQGLAVGFLVCAVYLAYDSAHAGSARLKSASEDPAGEELLADEDEAIDYERVGPHPLPLPSADAEVDPLPAAVVAPSEDPAGESAAAGGDETNEDASAAAVASEVTEATPSPETEADAPGSVDAEPADAALPTDAPVEPTP